MKSKNVTPVYTNNNIRVGDAIKVGENTYLEVKRKNKKGSLSTLELIEKMEGRPVERIIFRE